MDLAVGVVVGAAFGTVVTAFVKDLLTPLIGIGRLDHDFRFSKRKLRRGLIKCAQALRLRPTLLIRTARVLSKYGKTQ